MSGTLSNLYATLTPTARKIPLADGSGVIDAGWVRASDVLDQLGVAQGDVLFRGAAGWEVLPAGPGGYVLTTHSAGADPTWEVSGAGGGSVTSVDGSGGTTGLTLTGGPITSAGTLTLGGTLIVANGGTGLTTIAQGDLLYGSAANTLSALTKNTTATRYLSNTGTSNNPAWAAVNLANGVTGNLAVTNLDSGTGASGTTYWSGAGTWTTPAGSGTPSPLTTKGDIWGFSTVNARIPVGTNDFVLIADSTQTLGVRWGTFAAGAGGSDRQIQFNNLGVLDGSSVLTYPTPALSLTYSRAIGGNTNADGFVLQNPSAASAAVQQNAPSIHWIGQGWKTNATASSQTVDWLQAMEPVQDAANPRAQLRFYSQINGGGYTIRFTMDSDGRNYLGGVTAGYLNSTSGNVGITAQGTNQNVLVTASGTGYLATPSPVLIGDQTATSASGSADRLVNVVGSSAVIDIVRTSSGAPTLEFKSRSTATSSDLAYWDIYLLGTTTVNNLFFRNRLAGVDTNVFQLAPTQVKVLPSTAASSTSTGALTVAGGAGIAGAVYVGGLLNVAGDVQFSKTITPAGTTGNRTINNNTGSVRFAGAATSLVVTNSLVSVNSVIQVSVSTNDATMKGARYTLAAGSFTIIPDVAPTGETEVRFSVTN